MTINMKRPLKKQNKVIPIIIKYIVLIILTFIILTPIVILIFGSLKTRGEMYSRPYAIPNPPGSRIMSRS